MVKEPPSKPDEAPVPAEAGAGGAPRSRSEEPDYIPALRMASRVARIGAWEFDPVEQRLAWSDITRAIHEVPPDFEPDIETAINFYKEGESRERIVAAVELGMTTGQGWDLELQLVTATGREIWVRAIGNADMHDGQMTNLYGTFQDIDQQVRARLELERVTSLLQNTMAATTEVIFVVTDLEGTITLFNRGAENLLGHRAEDMVGKCNPVVLHAPEEVAARAAELSERLGRPIEGFQAFTAMADRDGSEQREWTYVRRDGSRFPATMTITPVRDTSGQHIGYLGVAQDISERIQMAQKLATAKERLELATQASGIGIWDWNVVEDELTWDDQMFELYGVDRDSFSGAYDAWQNGLHPDDRERSHAEAENALAGGDVNTEFRVRHPDGSVRHLRALARVVRDDAGRAIRMVGCNWDITNSVLRREELRVLAERAQQASHAKSQFLATMSHEIRTPMNGVIGFCQLLLESQLSNEQREFTESIRTSGEQLLAIIDDILDISKIEAGKMRLDIEPIDIRQIICTCATLWHEQASHKNLSLTIDDQIDTGTRAAADATRTRQVLINLVGNALKFTHEGSVTVRLRTTGTVESGGCVRIEVEDTGIGIPKDKQSLLFQNFTQADSSTTRRFGGTGLGLAICKQLVELMGGTIGFQSQIDVGSTFWFTLPLAPNVDAAPPVLARGSAADIRIPSARARALEILIVDDDATSRRLLEARLQRDGHRTTLAMSGQEAFDTIFSAGPFDLVFMDCQMPNLDGLGTTRMIRREEARRQIAADARVPIIAITANAMAGDRERCLAAGMDDYLSKPLDRAALRDVLDEWAARHAR